MLEYIKQQLAQREAERSSSNNDADILQNQMDEAIVEFAHLVDGMEELTMEGHNALRERPILDIPIEDDIELDSVELSLTTNRIMDIPSDITAMEGAYSNQKTFEDFYSEAMNYVTRLPRENEDHYSERVTEKAEELFTEYNNFIIQEGLFGNDMMSINDDRVPAKVVFDFGKYDGRDYIVKLKVGFEVDSGRRVNIKQIHALTIAQNLEVFRSVAGYLKSILANERHMYVGEVWDVAEPVRCIVPKYDGRYNVAIQFEVEGSDDVYVTWSIDEANIRKSKTGNPDMSNLGNIERPELKISSDNVSDMNILSKGKAVSESYAESYRPKTVPSRWDLYNDNTDYEYIEESTRSDVAWALIGCMAAGAAIGGLAGGSIGAAVSTLDMLIANAAYGGSVGGMLGATVGSWAAVRKVNDGIPKLFAKNVTKAISKCVQIANSSPSSEDVYISELKKFNKANKKLRDELKIWDPERNKKWLTATMYNSYTNNEIPENIKEALNNAKAKVSAMLMQLDSGKQKFEKKFLEEYLESLNDLLDAIWSKTDRSKVKTEGYDVLTLDDVIQEMAETDFIQEAIDFGGGDNSDAAPAGGNDQANVTPDAGGAAGGDNPPAVDNGGNDGSTNTTPSADAKPAAKNDVSDAIAAKVSNDTNSDPADLGMDAAPTFDSNPDVKLDLNPDNAGINTGSDDGGNVEDLEPNMNDTSDDMGKTDNFDTPTVDDSSINNDLTSDIDSSATSDEDAGVDNFGSSVDDIDNLSIDDLLAKGEDKLKGMSIAQLKDFLNDGLGGENEPTTEAAIDNSFKKRINVAARRCLGILNDKSKSLKQIILEFQNESKKFNVLLGQAYNTNYFEESAKENLRKCNKFLVDLRMNLKPNPSNNDKKKLVTLIKEFARNSKNVVKLCERDSAPVTMEYAMNCETDELGNIVFEWTMTKDYIKNMTPKRETFERLIRMAETYKKQLGDGRTIKGKDFTALKNNTDKYMKFLGAESKMLSQVIHDSDNRRLKASKQIKDAYSSEVNGFSNEEDDALLNAKLNKEFGSSSPEDDETINRLSEKKQKHQERMSKINNADRMLNYEDFKYSSRAVSELKNLSGVVRRLMYQIQIDMSYNGKSYKELSKWSIPLIRKVLDEYISKHEEFLRLLKK